MKKVILFAAIILAACTKLEDDKTIKFELSIFSGAFPTKSFSDEIATHYPNEVEITLTDTETNAQYVVITGEAVSIPFGTYSVNGSYAPDAIQKNYGSTKYLSYEPSILVSDTIEVVSGKDSYVVNASYNSFAIGVMSFTDWKVKVKDGSMESVNAINADGLNWIFANGYYSNSTPLVMSVGSKTFNLTLDTPADGQTQVETGKWYLLNGVPQNQSGSFSILNSWEEGTIIF